MCMTELPGAGPHQKKKPRTRVSEPVAAAMPDLSADALLQQLEQDEQQEGEAPAEGSLACLVCKKLLRGTYAVLPGCSTQGSLHSYCESCMFMLVRRVHKKPSRHDVAGVVSCALCGVESAVSDEAALRRLAPDAGSLEGLVPEALMCSVCLVPCSRDHVAETSHAVMTVAQVAAQIRNRLGDSLGGLEGKKARLSAVMDSVRFQTGDVASGEKQRLAELAAGMEELRRLLDSKEKELEASIKTVAEQKRQQAVREEKRLMRCIATTDEALAAVAGVAAAATEGDAALIASHRAAFNVVRTAESGQEIPAGRPLALGDYPPLPLSFLKMAVARCTLLTLNGAATGQHVLAAGGGANVGVPDHLSSMLDMISFFPGEGGMGGESDLDEDEFM